MRVREGVPWVGAEEVEGLGRECHGLEQGRWRGEGEGGSAMGWSRGGGGVRVREGVP